ncbi:hypothetical protein [Citrobacter farmeri]
MKFNNIRIMIPILFSLIFIYAISLIFIYTLPSVNAPDNISQSHKIFNEEGNYRVLSTEFKSQTQLDNFTDLRIMVPRSASSDNPSFAAIDMGGYSRYWHGYQVVLRPLISFFNYEQVRFLLSTLLISLLCVSSSLIWKRMGLVYSICFVVSMCFVHIEAIGMSVQFSSVFFIAMISSIFILKSDRYDDGIIGRLGIPAFFMIIGSVTNFFDLLTAPLLTLTLPLSILIIINDDVTLTNLKTIVITSISWSVGYALTWISKWIISYLFISHSAISDAINQIFFRSMGSEKYPLHREHYA